MVSIAVESRLDNLRLHKLRMKYWEWEKQLIHHLNKNLKLSYHRISSNYLIPYSTVRRIWAEDNNISRDFNWTCLNTKWNDEYKQIVISYIEIFWRTTNSTFVTMDIQKKIKSELDIVVDWKEIRSILKNNMNFSFKKWSSRPSILDDLRFSLIRALYTAEFIQFWNDDALFINVDEVLFTNKTKKEYSWLSRGKWGKVGNILFTGSKSLIVAVTSNGDWFATYLSWNNNSDVFISFMKKLILWIKIDLKQELKNSVIILDNLKVHRSGATMKFLSKCDTLFSFIPAYTPEIAPIELVFNILKKRLIKQTPVNGLKLYKKEALREIREAFSSIDLAEIQKCFLHSFQIMKDQLAEAYKIRD